MILIIKYFLSIPGRTVQNLSISSVSPCSYISEINVPSLNLTAVTDSEDVHDYFYNYSKKATGYDNLPIRSIKTCPESIGTLLTELIDKCILTDWQISRALEVCYCYTCSRDSSAMPNFRHISVLPAFLKLSERVIYDQLISHLLNFNLLSDFQSGFRPSHSMQDVLLHVVDCWRRAIDDGSLLWRSGQSF